MVKNKVLRKNETKGLLILKQVNFQDCLKKMVINNNYSSGKVQVPHNWINKQVYVVLVGDKNV